MFLQALGHITSHLAKAGTQPTVTNLKQPVNQWRYGGAPITGPGISQIGKLAVHKGKPYELLTQNASALLMDDLYRNPGPLQFEGPGADLRTITLSGEDREYIGRIEELQGREGYRSLTEF